MAFEQLFIGNFLNNCFFPFTVIYICSILIGKQKTRRQTIGAVIIYAVSSSLILSLLTHADIIRYHYIRGWTYPIVNLLDVLLLFSLLCFLFPKNKKLPLLFLLTFQSTVFNFIDWTLFYPTNFLENLIANRTILFLLYNIIFPWLVMFVQLIGLYFLKEKAFLKRLYYLANQPIFSLIFFLLYQISSSLSYFLYDSNGRSGLLLNGTFFLLILILILALKEIQAKQQIEQVDAQISEQNTYTHYLENIQKDLRKIQHDYKNMIAAVYAYAEANEPEAASHYIETHLLTIQEHSETHLHQLKMLRKITNLELRKVILDFIATFEESIPLVIEHEIDVFIPNPQALHDCLQQMVQQLSLNTAKLRIELKNQTLCLCYSGIKISQKEKQVASFVSTDSKITYFTKNKNQEIFYHLEIAL